MWLRALLLTLGIAAAMIGGAAVAFADDGGGDGSSSSASQTDSAAQSATTASSEASGGGASSGAASASSTSKKRLEASQNSNCDSAPATAAEKAAEKSAEKPSTTKTPKTSSVDTAKTTSDSPTEPAAASKTAAASETVATASAPAVATEPAVTEPAVTESAVAEPVPTKPTSAVVEPATAVDPPSAQPAITPTSTGDSTTPAGSSTTSGAATTIAATPSSVVSTSQPTQPLATPTPQQGVDGLQAFGNNLSQLVQNQILGFQRNLADLSADLARIFGFTQVVVTDPAPYGNPTANQQYWAQQNYYSASLATAAMAWAQLTGQPVDVQSFLDMAANTDSLSTNNAKMYQGADSTSFVLWTDSYELLQGKGVRVITNSYANDQRSQALNALATGLQDPSKVMIAAIKGDVDGYGVGSKTVVVLGVDTDNGTVTLNDPTRADGQGLTMNLDAFMSAWQTVNYRLVTTQLSATSGGPAPTIPAPSKTTWVWSPPSLQDFGQSLQDFGNNVAVAVVHQIQGVQSSLADLSADLARLFGVAHLTVAEPPAPGDIEYGDYAANKQYWLYQGNVPTCALMATAGVVGQLTGTMPTSQEIIDLATTTPSDVAAGENIFHFDGGGDSGLHWGTYNVDVVKLLNLYGINADLTSFLKSQGQLALQTMNDALGAKQGVMVSIYANIAWNANKSTYFNAYQPPPGILNSNHTVIVLSVDLSKDVVYLNDSALPNGQGFPVPLDKFMDAWQTSSFSLITAQLPAPAAQALAAA